MCVFVCVQREHVRVCVCAERACACLCVCRESMCVFVCVVCYDLCCLCVGQPFLPHIVLLSMLVNINYIPIISVNYIRSLLLGMTL